MIDKTNSLLWFLFFAGSLLTACTAAEPAAKQNIHLDFPLNLVVQGDGDTKITAGIRNDGSSHFPGTKAFNASLILRRAETGKLRARSELKTIEPLAPGASAFPLGWEGGLSPGEYQMVWGAPAYGTTVATFSVKEGGWTMLSLDLEKRNAALQANDYGALQSYVDEAKETLAAQEGIDLADIEVLRLEPLGEGQDVYRVDLGANGRFFEYHVNDNEALFVPKGAPLEPTRPR